MDAMEDTDVRDATDATDAAGLQDALAGFTVGVTAVRRADELIALLRRRGAGVVHGPALRIVAPADDPELLAVTEDLIGRPPDLVVATTVTGFRDWIGAAGGRGLREPLLDRLRGAELLARGPEVRAAVRAAGLTASWAPSSDAPAELLDRLLGEGVAGRRVALQLHGEPPPGLVEALRAAGAEVVVALVRRWAPPEDTGPLDRLLDAVAARGLDAVVLTSAPAAASLLRRAGERGLLGEVVAALRQEVPAMCVGPVTAAPLQALGIGTYQPERPRLGPLVELVRRELPARARVLPVAGRRVEIRGRAVLVDGTPRPVPPAGMALLGLLARRPGWVVGRPELLRALPGAGRDEHAVETAMARLRTALGAPKLIQTVVKRGYRLALDPGGSGETGGEG
ncbi:uroporphyrinogen-III synthase [Streptomyces sp. NPDC048659]|uniref:uroporphyrinogen-III synthase n=1 Tax=Streptomyces sp. NPDC048659 TaxID=3155489 RepID=UPI00344AFD45